MGSELNEKLHFLALTNDEQDSFYPSPVPVLTRFETGSFVYKWTAYELVHPGSGKITQYWFPWNGFKLGSRDVPGFKELRMRYRNVDGGVAPAGVCTSAKCGYRAMECFEFDSKGGASQAGLGIRRIDRTAALVQRSEASKGARQCDVDWRRLPTLHP